MADVIVLDYGGRCSIHHPRPGYTTDQALVNIRREGFVPPGTTVLIMDDSTLPTDRARRHAWRVRNGQVVDDPAIPDRPAANQALRDEVQAATTLAALKAALLKVLG